MKPFQIGPHRIGPGCEPFIIAELSGNHNGDLQQALNIVRAVAETGAQAIKLQTYTADTITIDVRTERFKISSGHELWGDRYLYDLYTEAHTPWEWHEPIFTLAQELSLLAFSSPFDPTAIDFLEELNVPAYKIASSEIVDLPLIRAAADTGKPVIISTGMASVAEIDAAVQTARDTGNQQIAVLKCTADYPADPSESNLRAIPVMQQAWGVPIGLSDHTPGIGAAVAAVALGATIVEKHVTLSRADGGVDSSFSLEPSELAALVAETKVAAASLGGTRLGASSGEQEGLRFRRSLYVVQDVKAGEEITSENVRSIRPAGGLPPEAFAQVAGRIFPQDLPAGTPLQWELL